MSASNLAIVFGPNLLSLPSDQMMRMMEDSRLVSATIVTLIENEKEFFPVCSFLLIHSTG